MSTRVSNPLVLALLVFMAVLAGGAALRESPTFDEIAHIGAGVSYFERLDLRFNPEHPPLPKMLAATPLIARGGRADYSSVSWTASRDFLSAFMGQWVFGQSLLAYWNDPASTLAWARAPMLLLTLLLGWVLYCCSRRLGGPGAACSAFASMSPRRCFWRSARWCTPMPPSRYSPSRCGALPTLAGAQPQKRRLVRPGAGGRAPVQVHRGPAVPLLRARSGSRRVGTLSASPSPGGALFSRAALPPPPLDLTHTQVLIVALDRPHGEMFPSTRCHLHWKAT